MLAYFKANPASKPIFTVRKNSLNAKKSVEPPTPEYLTDGRLLAQQLLKRFGLRQQKEFEQMICAKVDDAWASIESAEGMLGGRTRTSQSWGRLCALKLQVFAHYPILSFIDRLEEYNQNDPLLNELRSHNRQGVSFKQLISVSELTQSVIEGNWEIVSPELLAAIRCSWFD